MQIILNKQKLVKIIESPWFIVGVMTFLALILRLWSIGTPTTYIYDETYYVKYAKDLLGHQFFIDVHPPMGEMLIGLGIKIFGTTSAGWRILPALLGTGIIPVSYTLAWKLFKNQTTALLTAFFITFDCLFLIQSRAALLTIFLTFFIALGTLLYFTFHQNKNWWYLIAASTSFGIALSVQWLAAPIWGALILHFITTHIKFPHLQEPAPYSVQEGRQRGSKYNWLYLIFGLLIMTILPAIIYILCFIPVDHEGKTYWQYIAYWHKRSWEFQQDLRAPHKYGSRWYIWLILYRPVLYFQAYSSGNIIKNIIVFGNPLLWWSALVAYLYSLWMLITRRKWDLPILMPVLLFSAYYFGWAIIKRPQFFYYLLPVLVFYFMILAYFVEKLLKRYFLPVVIWLVAIALIFLLFYPSLSCMPIPKQLFQAQLWLPEWRNVLITYPR